jgi:uncharacterized protein with beta-barrel porin domain
VVVDALDQLHPAIYSAFGELQADLGGQLLSMFHRRPGPTCCTKAWRVWVEPYGNWLDEGNVGIEKGFDSWSLGIAGGFDWELTENLVLGFGGVGNHSDLTWNSTRGHSIVNGFYGGAYVDYVSDYLYLGGSLLGGADHYNSARYIQFTTINETARSEHNAMDIMGQFSCGAFVGPSSCCAFPFLNVDYLVLQQFSFDESGAATGLNLSVDSFNFQTVRTELGLGLQVQDRNPRGTICIAPKIALGWAMEAPIYRQKIKSTFQGETLPYEVWGWDQTWQLFTFKLGMNVTYRCFSLSGEYEGEIDGNDTYWGQRANVNLLWSF